ncbi:MAG: hypothetical protein VKP63_09955 [Cyanobacteriota bacterium]|nr:hypothetical protein [Cyanobacteriota bacterium]
MPIESPQLDDLRYDAVVQALLRRIPAYAPEWTDWNDSDPGITLIQLFAYLAEQVGYRLNQIPEKNHVELLKLLGVRLRPALPARTRVAIFLAAPATLEGFALEARSRFMTKGSTPAIFESDRAVDIVPAEPSVLLTTRHPFLFDLLRRDEAGAREPAPADSALPKRTPAADSAWLSVVWDGSAPPGKDLPIAPLPLLPATANHPSHPYLWLGLRCNRALGAGFTGLSVSLTVQLDDDELPDFRAEARCDPRRAEGEAQPPSISWLAYWDADLQAVRPVPGRIDDGTNQLSRSGTIRFTVPLGIGPIPSSAFVPLREAVVPSPVDVCEGVSASLLASLTPTGTTFDTATFQKLLTTALTTAQKAKNTAKPAVDHPLDPALRDPSRLACWLRFGPLDPATPSPRLRHMGFNVVPLTQASTVEGELLGTSDGRPGQIFRLAHHQVLAGSLELGIQESPDPGALLVPWREVASLDGAGPGDRVFELDPEAGILRFGDGQRGRIPPLVATAGSVVALRYRWGGGLAGEADTGAIQVSAAQFQGLAGVSNIVPARGGRDAETLEEAKQRARKELSTRGRAVTADDFAWIALRTPTVRVRRAIVVPRRRPSNQPCAPAGQAITSWTSPGGRSGLERRLAPESASDCGPPLPAAGSGLEDGLEAPGVVSVVVVPDAPQPPPAVPPSLVELVPSPSFLREVCRHLDQHRLVTTEVHVVPPQYLRLCRVYCRVRPRVGYTRQQLRDRVADALASFLDVLVGGPDGQGAPFGGQVHIADLIALVLRTEGVERVEELQAHFVRTKSNAPFREGNLMLCPVGPDDHDHVDLAPEETTSLDLSSFRLDTTA